jgi:16S rRNA (adenine1518-N6/adenine1519-N6)-dimethyltransferase
MTKAEVIKILKSLGITPKESLGQNFLIDEKITERIISETKLLKANTILEIGPGLGVLTEHLVKQDKKYLAIEKDKILFNYLKEKFKNENLIEGDVLKCAYSITEKMEGTYAVVTNLPYNISARTIRLFLTELKNKPEVMIMMLQKEVAEKCVASAGDMSKVSILAQLYSEPHILFPVKSASFYPEPEIDSVIIKFDLKKIPNECFPQNEKMFWQIVRIGFSSKRKKLVNNVSAGLRLKTKDVRNSLNNMGLSDNCRAQELTLEQWVIFVDKLTKNH